MTEEEKKPVVGQEFLNQATARILKKASGKDNTPDEGKKTDWEKEAKTAEDRHRYQQSMKAMSGDEQVEALRLQREQEMASEREAAATRAQQLEDERNQRTKTDIDEAKKVAQDEAAERKRLEEEQRAAERATVAQKQAEMTEKFNQAMQASSPEAFLKNYRTWKELQRELDPEEKSSTGTDPTIAIELKKLELQQSKEDREFKWKMRQDDKQFQLDMKKMDDEREFRRAELAQQAKKDAMWASTPERFGRMFGKTVLEGEEEEGISAPATKQKSGGQAYHIEIGEGEAGEVPCPNCNTAVGVGPSSKAAVCVGCGSKFAVTRKAAEPASTEEELKEL